MAMYAYKHHHIPKKMLTSIVQTLQLLHPFSLLPLLLFLFFIFKPNSTLKKNLPPSPPRLPIIGNLHQLGTLPYRSLHTLSQNHGDLMLLHLGNKPTIVISSAEVASQILKTHDLIFAGRPKLSIFQKLLRGGKGLIPSPYGEFLRKMRSICILHLLSNKKVRSFRDVREEEVALMVKNIQGLEAVDLTDMFKSLSSDVICRVALGKKYKGEEVGFDFNKMLTELAELLGGYYIGDFISWLGWIDRLNTGFEARVKGLNNRFDQFLDRLLENHQDRNRERNGGDEEHLVKDFVDVLLDIHTNSPSEYPLLDMEIIKALILNIFAAAAETTAVHLEWTMAELVKNPRVLQQLQNEVTSIVGDKEVVTEDELENMDYLKAVLKESLRLHPPVPVLVPHESSVDVKINGYGISSGTQVFINAWAIGRNPSHWENPERFYPERFLNSAVDYKGQDFRLIPFGSGRRMCPGMAFSTATSQLVIANLVYKFNWSLLDGAACEGLDMTESPSVSMHKKVSLLVVPSARKKI